MAASLKLLIPKPLLFEDMKLSLAFDRTPNWAKIAFFLLFLSVYSWFKFTYHELWKDEWQAWLMARDMSWKQLLGSLYYEGHPALWYVYLKGWTGLGAAVGWSDVFSLQSAHTLVAAAAYAVLLFRMRLPLWLKIAVLLGYYPLFEYGLVSRGYAFVMLFAFLLAAALEQPRKNTWLTAVWLFLLCQTEVYGVLMAATFLGYLFWKEGQWAVLRERWYLKLAGAGFLGAVVFIVTVYPRASQDELASAYLDQPLAIDAIAKAWQGTLANTYYLGSIPDTNVFGYGTLGLILSAVVLAGLIHLFWRERPLLYSFLFFQLSFLLFAAVIYTGGVRQWGTAVIFWVALLQLWQYERPSPGWSRWLVVGSILFFQLYYSVLGLQKEYRYPFSHAKAAGLFLREKVPPEVPIVAINKFEAAPVLGYAGRTFYALPEGEPFTYFKWVEKVYLPPEHELGLFAQYKQVGGIIVVSPKALDPDRYPHARLWESFDGYNLKNENYYLYTLSR